MAESGKKSQIEISSIQSVLTSIGNTNLSISDFNIDFNSAANSDVGVIPTISDTSLNGHLVDALIGCSYEFDVNNAI